MTGPHAHTPRTHSQWVVGPGRTPQRTSGRGWESAGPRTPPTQARGAPPGRPRAAPTAHKASSPERALWGALKGGTEPQARQGGNGTGPPPPPPSKSNGARDRGRIRAGAHTTWNGPTGAQHGRKFYSHFNTVCLLCLFCCLLLV